MSYDDFDIDVLLFGEKVCSRCLGVFPRNSEHVDRDTSQEDGLRRICKTCTAEAGKAAYQRKRARGLACPSS